MQKPDQFFFSVFKPIYLLSPMALALFKYLDYSSTRTLAIFIIQHQTAHTQHFTLET